MLEINSNQQSGYENKIHILPDYHNGFWIYVTKDGLYRYLVTDQKIDKIVNLPDIVVSQIALSNDGIIYFQKYNEKIYSEDSFFRITEGMLYEINPSTKMVNELKLPDEAWPIFNGMLVDDSGNLWLGENGYRGSDGQWYLMHPDPSSYFIHAGDPAYAPLRLIAQSSDGILWYNRDMEDVRIDGTAWYDPKSKNGCLFTNFAGSIVEDSNQRLWLKMDRKLFLKE